MRTRFALSLLAFSMVGCSDPSEERGRPADGSVAVLGPGMTTRLELELGGVVRSYLVHVPASYTGETGVPLLFLVHGYSQSASTFIAGTDVVPLSEREGFVAVVPDGSASHTTTVRSARSCPARACSTYARCPGPGGTSAIW